MKCSFGLEKTNLLLSLKSSCSLLVGQIFILSCIRYVLKPFQFYCFLAELLVFENNSAVLLSPNGCLKVEVYVTLRFLWKCRVFTLWCCKHRNINTSLGQTVVFMDRHSVCLIWTDSHLKLTAATISWLWDWDLYINKIWASAIHTSKYIIKRLQATIIFLVSEIWYSCWCPL